MRAASGGGGSRLYINHSGTRTRLIRENMVEKDQRNVLGRLHVYTLPLPE